LGNNAVIKGEKLTIPQDETNPVEIPGNRVVVHGGLTLGTNVSFDSYEGGYWDGLYIDSPYTVVMDQFHSNKCNLVKENGGLSVNNSTFTDSGIECTNANLIISNCQVQNGVYCYNNDVVDISGSSFTGAGNGIVLESCHDYSIVDCQVTGMTGKGIGISETNGTYNTIERCTVSQNRGDGITFYHSNGNVIGCTIVGNNKGVVIFQNSVVAINKEPGTDPNMHDSYIANNTWQEILFITNCDLMMDGGRNQVVDNDYDQDINTFDKYLIQCPNLDHSVSMRKNYWGYHDGSVNEHPLMPPADRFYPDDIYGAYVLDPVWSPGLPHIITEENDELIYQEAIDLAVEGDVSGAIYLFKSIISECPQSHLVKACAKNLYALEEDKGALKDYYSTEPNLHWNGDIDKLADYLEKYCDIKMGNYQEAIPFFEEIISNPPSELDSLMAVIDLGYTYCMMQEYPPKSAIMCMYPKLKPTSKRSYELSRDAILSCLYTQAGGGNNAG